MKGRVNPQSSRTLNPVGEGLLPIQIPGACVPGQTWVRNPQVQSVYPGEEDRTLDIEPGVWQTHGHLLTTTSK